MALSVKFNRDLAKFTTRQLQAVETLKSGECKFLLYGGALGGGKSYFLRWFAVRRLLELAAMGFRNVTGMLACEDYPALKDRQLQKIETEFPEWLGKQHSDHRVYGRSFVLHPDYGSGVVCFRNLDQPAKYQSSEWAFIFVDELTKNVYDTFTFLRTRLRWPGIPDDQCYFIGATNPGGVGHCVDEGEVLTPEGWKDIRKFKIGDPVYTVAKDGTLYETKTEQVHKHRYQGELIKINTRGCYMSFTPNHQIAKRFGTRKNKNTRNRVSDLFSIVPFSDLPGQATVLRSIKKWDGKELLSFAPAKIKTRRLRIEQPTKIDGDSYAKLMGWILTEGFTIDRDKAFGIAQMKTNNRKQIETLLDECGFHYVKTKSGFMIYAADWWDYLRQFGKCREKFVPKNLKLASKKQLQILLVSMMDGDGHWIKRKQSGTFYSFSKQLADDFAEIAVKAGYIVSGNSRRKENRNGKEYHINIKKTLSGGTEILTGNHIYNVNTYTKRRSNIQRVFYDGDVYCIGVPETHTFIIRQKGSVWVSGNSWVKGFWMDKTFPPEFYDPVDYTTKFHYVPAKADDNPHLDEAYWAMLNTLPENLRAAFRDGDWDIFVGQAFPEFNQTYHIEKPRQVPEHARLYQTYDWGFGAPYSCGYWWVDEDGRLHRFAELYGAVPGGNGYGLRQTDEEQAEKMKAFENTLNVGLWDDHGNQLRPITRYADPTCWNKKPDYKGGGQGPATAEVFRSFGIDLIPGDPHRHLKKRQFHARLRVKSELDPETGEERVVPPMMMISSDCKDFIRTIPNLQIDENDIEDVDTTGEDHCLAGDTRIITDKGAVEIKSLVGQSGLVLTAGGYWDSFKNCRLIRKKAETVRVVFEDGHEVVCTPDHRFLTENGFWVEARDIVDKACHVCIKQDKHIAQLLPKERGAVCASGLSTRPRRNLTGKDTGFAGGIFKEREGGCIGLCMSTIGGGCQRAENTISTTKMEIFITTRLKTLSFDPLPAICPFTAKIQTTKIGSKQCAMALPSGTALLRAGSGTESIMKKTARMLLKKQRCMAPAKSAADLFSDPNLKNTVAENASKKGGFSKVAEKKGFALSARKVFWGPDRLVQNLVRCDPYGKSVRVVAVKNNGPCSVYCLDTKYTHGFAIENSVIVHNCYDEAALMCMARPLALDKEEEKRRAAAERQKADRAKLDSTSQAAWESLDQIREEQEQQADAEKDAFSELFEGF